MKKIFIFLLIFFLAFILNFLWEILHFPLYIDLTGIPKYPHLLIATLTDAIIITFIFMLISLLNKNTSWIRHPKISDYLLIIIPTLIIASAIELYSVSNGRWSYKEIMPTIFGIGLSPLIQLAVTGIITLRLIKIFR